MKIVAVVLTLMLACSPVYALSETQINNANTLIDDLNIQINAMIRAREDVLALIRIHDDISSDSEELTILANAKARVGNAATAIGTLVG